mgnify:CR=1 FL=1
MSEQFDSSRPIYAQLVERLKARILAGTYPPGGHLDSVRDLAAAAGVNPNTMQRALAQLEQDGLAKADRTAGRLVTQDTAILDAVRRAEAHVVVNQYYHAMAELGYSQQEATAMLKEEEQ